MEVSDISGAGIATIAFIWEEIFNNLADSACGLKGLGLCPLGDCLVAFAAPFMQAATYGVLLCLHCVLFTIAVVHPRGSLCLIPRPCEGPVDGREVEIRCMQWACIGLYLATSVLLTKVLVPLSPPLQYHYAV